ATMQQTKHSWISGGVAHAASTRTRSSRQPSRRPSHPLKARRDKRVSTNGDNRRIPLMRHLQYLVADVKASPLRRGTSPKSSAWLRVVSMPKRTLEDSPERLVEDGQLRFGSFRQPIRHPNLIDARAPFGFFMPRPLRSFRLKEWQAMQTGNGRLFMHIALFNAKLMSMVQVKIFDRESNQKYVFEKPIPGSTDKDAKGRFG